MSFPRIGAVAALASLAVAPCLAQVPQDTTTVQLPDIIVSESRVPLPASAVTSAVTVLSGAELREKGLSLVQDALREVPGISVVQPGSFGAVTSLFSRGGESDYVKVLVDGIPVNEPGGAFDFSTLTLDDVERIEVTRGPASVTYGSDAVTGVVRIVTRQGRGATRGSVEGEAGTFGSWLGRTSAAGATGALAWSAGASSTGSSGTYDFNSDFRNSAASGHLVFRPDQRSDIAATARYGWNTFHFPTDGSGVPSDSNQFSRGRALALGLDAGRQLSGKVELRMAAAYARNHTNFDDRSDGAWDTTGFGFASSRQGTSSRLNLDGRVILRPELRSLISVGVQAERQLVSTDASYTSNFGGGASTDTDPPFDRSRNDGAVYLEVRAEPLTGLVVTTGGRLDDDEAFGTHGTWRAGARLGLPRGFALRASAGTGFKAPTFAENFANSPFEVGNPDLDPERSRSWEAGVEQELASGTLRTSLTWYDQRFRNLIQYVTAAPGEPTYQNLGAALARGLEATVSVRPVALLTLGGSWSYLETRVTDAGASTSPAFVEGGRLLRRPAEHFRFWSDVEPRSGWHLNAELAHTGSRDDVDFGVFPSQLVTLRAFTTVNLAVSAELMPGAGRRPGVTLIARMENLFDADYEVISGFPGRGRSVMAGVRVGW